MLNFWKSVLGLVSLIAGISVFIWITNARLKGEKGGYGAHINIYTGAIILIVIGLFMFIGELMKL